MTHLLALALLLPLGQATSDVILTFDFQNVVNYNLDPAESALWMSSSAKAPDLPSTYVYPLKSVFCVGDLVAVNDKPAKGTVVWWTLWTYFSMTLTQKRPIADISRTSAGQMLIEVNDGENGQVGTLAALVLSAGNPPPGAPPGSARGAFAITGGTGVWSGGRGQGTTISASFPTRSAVEDPAYRRINGGGKWRIGVTLNSVAVPTVVGTYHADFSPVSASSPAHAGELLILAVKGLGPTNPTLVPGKTFDGNKLAVVTSPVTATVSDMTAPVVNAVGSPGTTDTYRVDIRLPNLAPGTVSAAITVAWMQGPEFKIPIQ
jgi:uncharacterized protein (TIGR03437 family)